MKKRLTTVLWFGILTAGFILLSAFDSGSEEASVDHPTLLVADDKLKKAAFEILKTKCNVCHKKKNPFMVFNEKNMVKRAPKIYKMVYVERRMPQGDKIKLTHEEYATLEKWLFTQQIF